MKIKKFETFLKDFGDALKPSLNMSIYQSNYSCGCGKIHWFPGYGEILCEGRNFRFMMQCPEDPFIINEIKIKTFLIIYFKGLQTLASVHLQSEEELSCILATGKLVRML